MQTRETGRDLDADRHTRLSHDAHFLLRAAARPSGEDMERAMRLYHHASAVREVLHRLLPPRRPTDRVAIALAARPPSAHVVVTWTGAFVTFLSGGMAVRGSPVVPYGAFAPALEAQERRYAQAAVRRRQLARLPVEDLFGALYEGPGHVTREMVQTMEEAHGTYDLTLLMAMEEGLKCAQSARKLKDQLYGDILDFRKNARFVELWQGSWRRLEDAGGIIEQCIHLLGLVDRDAITERLGEAAGGGGAFSVNVAFAVARHRGGGPHLLSALRREDAPRPVRAQLLRALIGHAMWHPRAAPAIADDLQRRPPPDLELQPGFFLSSPRVARALPQEAEELVVELGRHVPPPPDEAAEGRCPITLGRLHAALTSRLPLSFLFPPAAEAHRMRAAWARHLDEPPLPEVPEVKQHVRAGPRRGRNEPCACGSGKKSKRCCG